MGLITPLYPEGARHTGAEGAVCRRVDKEEPTIGDRESEALRLSQWHRLKALPKGRAQLGCGLHPVR
jgi:hypothetical protein